MTLYRTTRKVRLQDVDAAGIVFFPRFLEYCHDAYFEHLAGHGMDLTRAIAEGPYILPLVHAEADFRAPLRFGDEISIRVLRAVSSTTSYTVHYAIHKADAQETLCCEAKTVHAAISRTTFKPLKELPEELRLALAMEPPAD